jgi:hypothetical protein
MFRPNLEVRYGADMARFRGAYTYVGVAMSYQSELLNTEIHRSLD